MMNYEQKTEMFKCAPQTQSLMQSNVLEASNKAEKT